MAEELYARAATRKQVYWIDGADHNNGLIAGGADYREHLQKVIEEWTGEK